MERNAQKMIRVVLIEDNRYIRGGWEMMLQGEPDFQIAGSFAAVEDALLDSTLERADVVVMDLKLSGMSGIEGTALLKRRYPDLAVVICTVYEDDENIFRSLCAGAVGFLAKRTRPSDFLDALRDAVAGRSPMSPKVAQHIMALAESRKIRLGKSAPDFSEAEREILSGIAAGNSYNAIAVRLSLPLTEITQKIRQIYQKLHLHFSTSIKEELL